MKKKFLAILHSFVLTVLTVVMIANAANPAAATPRTDYTYDSETDSNLNVAWNAVEPDLPLVASFSDVKPGNWFYDDVMECAKLGIVAGFEDGTFRPQDNVTYAQLVVMLTRTFYNDYVTQVTDTIGKPWYYANMQVMVNRYMHNGTDIKNKGGWPVVIVANNNINRYEMARLLHNIIEDFGKGASDEAYNAAQAAIKDWDQVPAPVAGKTNYKVCVKNCYALGIITGMSDGSFSGTSNMTRAQACTVMVRMLKLINNYNPGTTTNNTNGNTFDNGKNQPVTGTQTPTQPETKTLANGQPITVENVMAIMDQVRSEYPTGTIWADPASYTGTNYYAAGNNSVDVKGATNKFRSASGNGGQVTSTTYGCGGFAAMVSDRIFGQSGFPAREVTDPSKLRPGDIVINVNDKGLLTHVSIVDGTPFQTTGLSGTQYWSFYATDGGGNYNTGSGRITWGSEDSNSWNTIGGSTQFRFFTRYPD